MLRPGTVGETEYSPQNNQSKTNVSTQPRHKKPAEGCIQKISQEGSKNTYVIILSKDCLKSKSDSVKGPPVIKQPSLAASNFGRSFSRIQREFESHKGVIDVGEKEFESPTIGLSECRITEKPNDSTEDVRLNLSNIDDDEYDSNLSASSVFLKPEQVFEDQDSAIQSDISCSSFHQENANQSHAFYCQKSKMNTYFIQSPLVAQQQKKANLEQHKFPMISPQCVGNRQGKLVPGTACTQDSPSTTTARKIVVVNPAHGPLGSSLKKSVTYTNEAVPVINKSVSSTPANQLSKSNPKAVPTFNNISPINQQTHTPLPSKYVSSVPVSSGASTGPLTSTPIVGDSNLNSKSHHHRQESSTHRPVYIIPSPFNKNGFTGEIPGNKQCMPLTSDPYILLPSTPNLNNSSGFISGSSSLDTPDASNSFECVTVYNGNKITDSNPVGNPKDNEAIGSLYAKHDSMTAASVKSEDGAGGIVIHVDQDGYSPMELDQGLGFDSETDPSIASSQESESSDTSEKGLNRSLTNIQWLKGMQLKEEKVASNSPNQQQQRAIQWKTLSPEEIQLISSECGRHKRPPFSYMAMIQMALHSRADCKMMLKEICKWIEDTFPYYKFTAKPGWKSSIRHNLSLYNIFERESTKRHGSYWTIKPDMEPRTKQYQKERQQNKSTAELASDVHRSTPSLPSQTSENVIPIIPMYSSMGQLSAITPQSLYMQQQAQGQGKKKGPPPILPRPSPIGTPQAFALIPISNVNQAFSIASPTPQQQVIVNLAGGQSSACPSPGISEMSAAVASIQVSCASPIPPPEICDQKLAQNEQVYTKKPHINIMKQAWLDCQSTDTVTSLDSDVTHSNEVASSSEIASSNEYSGNRAKSKRPRDKPCLPKPTLYKNEGGKSKLSGSKRRKLLQKERSLLNESSDEDDEGAKFISNLEKDILAKPKYEKEVEEALLTTSTPLKRISTSTLQLPSPIRGLTPLRDSSLFEGSFLDTLGDRKALGLSPNTPVIKKNPSSGSLTLNDTPNTSLLDFSVLPFTSPDKLDGSPEGSQNLSRFLIDYGLDPNMTDNNENWNWNIVQMVDENMDTS